MRESFMCNDACLQICGRRECGRRNLNGCVVRVAPHHQRTTVCQVIVCLMFIENGWRNPVLRYCVEVHLKWKGSVLQQFVWQSLQSGCNTTQCWCQNSRYDFTYTWTLCAQSHWLCLVLLKSAWYCHRFTSRPCVRHESQCHQSMFE